MKQKNGSSVRNFGKPDETRPFRAHGKIDILTLAEGTELAKAVFEPGWKWSTDVKPIVKTDNCQVEHVGYCLSGSMTVRMENGHQIKINKGDAFHLSPGHDAWVEGHEPCVLLDFVGHKDYAKEKKAA